MPGAWTPSSALAYAVYAAGFSYDPDQDIIYSRMDAPQRKLGYAFGYDAAAFGINAVIDCEPIFFDYDGKHWMIELWKGQYGLETGCELGVYTRPIGSTGLGYALLDATVGQRPGDPEPSHNLFYDCASDADRLDLSFTLHRDGVALFSRGPDTHWWLTGFKWGVLSDPSQLTVDISITLKDDAMRDAFVTAIDTRSYPDLRVNGTTVAFTFGETFAVPQPPRPTEILAAVEEANRTVVAAYNALGLTSNDPNVVEADFLSVTGLSMLQSGDWFGRIASQHAIEGGASHESLVPALGDGFGVAGSAIEGWVNGASVGFGTWVTGVQRYLGLVLDFSCYVMIDNSQGASDLMLSGSSAASGSFTASPPRWIPQGSVARFVLQDPKPSVFGTVGTVTYTYCDDSLTMKTVVFSFECPTGFAANRAASSQPEWGCVAKSGDANGRWSATVPAGGHPLHVSWVIGGGQPSEGRRRHVTATRKNSDDEITHLCGGPDAGWAPVPVAEAIVQIRSSALVYFTSANGDEALVQVIEGAQGPYLRTRSDSATVNNLDELPDC